MAVNSRWTLATTRAAVAGRQRSVPPRCLPANTAKAVALREPSRPTAVFGLPTALQLADDDAEGERRQQAGEAQRALLL